jgi:hypothetical protein
MQKEYRSHAQKERGDPKIAPYSLSFGSGAWKFHGVLLI